MSSHLLIASVDHSQAFTPLPTNFKALFSFSLLLHPIWLLREQKLVLILPSYLQSLCGQEEKEVPVQPFVVCLCFFLQTLALPLFCNEIYLPAHNLAFSTSPLARWRGITQCVSNTELLYVKLIDLFAVFTL